VIQDYLAARLPEKAVVCPEDRTRLAWQDWRAFDQGAFGALQPPPSDLNKRWPYSSSYMIPPSAFDRSPVGSRIYQAAWNSFWIPGTAKLGNRKMADVMYPSQKVLYHDQNQRHFGQKRPFWGHVSCRQPLLAYDTSVIVRRVGDNQAPGNLSFLDCNRGWQPNAPTGGATPIQYVPASWDPEALLGAAGDPGWGYYRWTRGGLRGVDYGAKEVNTTSQ
jgi:hypothetical protein